MPQKWETPSWEFDLLIPLLNEDYLMASIATESNDIEFTNPDSTNFIIELNESVIDSGYVQTDESFFIIPKNNLDFNLQNLIIPNPNPMPQFPSINEEILLSSLIPDSDLIGGGKCFSQDLDFLDEDIEESIEQMNNSVCDGIGEIECLNQLNWLTIGQGSNTFTVNNGFPFKINEFRLQVISNHAHCEDFTNEESCEASDVCEWNIDEMSCEEEYFINNYLTNIDDEEIEISNLFNKNLGCNLETNIYIRIDENLELSDNYESCELYNQDTCEQLGYNWDGADCLFPIIINEETCVEFEFTWSDNEDTGDGDKCLELIPNIPNPITCTAISEQYDGDTYWYNDECYLILEMSESVCSDFFEGIWENDECYIACTSNQTCCDAIGGNWNGNECIDLPSGIWITGDEKLTISNQIDINNFQSLNADIECTIDTTYSVELPVDENMILIEGHIELVDTTIIDTNRIAVDLTNNFFTDITFNMFSNNLFNSNNEALFDSQTISEGGYFQDILLSDYTIKNQDGSGVDSLSIGYSVIVEEESATLNFDEPYGLGGEGVESKTIKLDELKVNLNEFSTSDIDLGNLPSGFEGFDLPFLKFNLYLYNQISADMKLYLDLYGISDDDTLKIHVEPNIKFLGLPDLNPEYDTDSLVISFFQDTMAVEHIGNGLVHEAPVIEVMDHKITDLFSYDIIDISGYAVMDGDATLIPEKSLWGDVEILISPLTIVIKDGDVFSFVPDNFTGLDAMDRQTAAKIDSGLVSATLNMNMNNQIPFGGNLLMYISNSPDYFPLCIDSLFTSNIDNQIVDSTCKADIQNYLSCSSLEVLYDSSNTFVSHLDCIGDSYNYYYENLLNIEFESPALDSIGIVLDSIITHQSTILENQISYFTRDSAQYLIPRFVFDSELDTITFQPSNVLSINSHLIFKLISSGLLEE